MSCPYNKKILAWQNSENSPLWITLHVKVSYIKVHYSNSKKSDTKRGYCITRNLLQWHLGLTYESWPKGIPLRLFHWEAFQPVISFPSNSTRKAFFLNSKIKFYIQIIIRVFLFIQQIIFFFCIQDIPLFEASLESQMEKDYHWVLLRLKQIIFNIKVLGNNSNNQKKKKKKLFNYIKMTILWR